MSYTSKYSKPKIIPKNQQNQQNFVEEIKIVFEKLSRFNLRSLLKQINEILNYELALDKSVAIERKTDSAIFDQVFLGQGGNGFVLKYINKDNSKPVAIKFFARDDSYTTELANNKKINEIFSEAGVLDNIISFYENGNKDINLFGKNSKLFFIVMEFVNSDLEKVICEKNKEEPKLKQQYFTQVFQRLIQSLKILHNGGHIHRDIKPSNILMNGEYPLLSDFGLVVENNIEDTKKGPKYWPTPEFVEPCENNDQIIDKQTDIFQMGCIFYWMLTLKYPIGFFDFNQELNHANAGEQLIELVTNMLIYDKANRKI